MAKAGNVEINFLKLEGCRNVFDLGDYQLYNHIYPCVLYKEDIAHICL